MPEHVGNVIRKAKGCGYPLTVEYHYGYVLYDPLTDRREALSPRELIENLRSGDWKIV